MNFIDKLEQEIKREVSCAIRDAIEVNMVEDRNARDFIVYPMGWARMWAHIGTNVAERLVDDKYVVIKARRGAWPFVLVLDRSSRTLFTIMSKDRYLGVQKKWNGKSYHYLDLLVCRYNRDVAPCQMSLDIEEFPHEKYSDEELEEELSVLLSGYKDEIDRNVLICFERHEGVLLTLRAYLLSSPTLGIADEENWFKYIGSVASASTIANDEPKVPAAASYEVEVKLKKKGSKESINK
jgi:hypothetical protein